MKKYLLTCLFILLSIFSFAKEYMMLIPNGLPTMALAQMIEEKKELAGEKMQYVLPKGNDRLMVEMMKGTPDIAVIPSNLAAQLYQKQGEYKILGTLTSSSFYILGRESISDWKELQGKKLYSFGKGLTPDVILQTILKNNQVKENVDIQYLTSGVEAFQMYLQDQNSFVFLSEPMVSQSMTKDKNTKVLFSMEEEWKKQFPQTTGFPQAVVVIKKEYVNDSSLKLALDQALQESIRFLHNSPRRREVLAKNGFAISEELLKQILKRANIEWKGIFKEKENFEQYYKILEKENPKMIGGKLPEESIYAK